jgi:hypothetical protein
MAALPIKLTNAGLAAVQSASGSSPTVVTEVGLTVTAFDFAPTLTALPGEFKRLAAVSGVAAAPNVTHLTVYDTSSEVWSATSFGLFLSDGTLLAVYAGTEPVMNKAGVAFALLACDIAFEANLAASIDFGEATFTYPPATAVMRGAAELATQDEVDAGVDDQRIVTPAKLASRLGALLLPITTAIGSITTALATFALRATSINGGGLVTGGGDLTADRTLTVSEASAAEIDAGTVADKVVTPRRLRTVLDNIGSALDALRTRTITGGGLVSGGGDLSQSRTLTVTEASAADIVAGTAADKVVTPRRLGPVTMVLEENGFLRFFGFQIAWGRFTATANTTTAVSFRADFPNACFSAVVSGVYNPGTGSQDNTPAVIVSTITKAGFSVFSADDENDPTCYIAVGY